MSNAHTPALLIFARNPVAGRVKTRLATSVGAETAVAVYQRLLADTLAAAGDANGLSLQLWIDAQQPNIGLRDIASPYTITWRRQQGDDLGARMCHALGAALREHRRAVLIGSDCPQITSEYIDAAYHALDTCEVVIGPASDGGYVLIGMKQTHTQLFDAIPWSTGSVMYETRHRLKTLGLSWTELTTLSDIDELADVEAFPHLSSLTR